MNESDAKRLQELLAEFEPTVMLLGQLFDYRRNHPTHGPHDDGQAAFSGLVSKA
jgi:hypothetical protein